MLYRESLVRSASPVQLVISLYEQAIQDLRSAAAATRQHDIGARTGAINHALAVIGQLQASLDRERGGDVARDLDRFYNNFRRNVLEAQIQGSAEILEQEIQNLLVVHGAWLEVERASAAPPSGAAASASPAAADPSSPVDRSA